MLIANKDGVLRLSTGWIAAAAKKSERAEKQLQVYTRKLGKGGKPSKKPLADCYQGDLDAYALVEKNVETLTALLKRPGEFIVYSSLVGRYIPLADYVKARAERKAAKEAQAATMEVIKKEVAAGADVFVIWVDGSYNREMITAGSMMEALQKFGTAHPDALVMKVERNTPSWAKKTPSGATS